MNFKLKNQEIIEAKKFQKVKSIEVLDLFKTDDARLINHKMDYDVIKCEYPDTFNLSESVELIAKSKEKSATFSNVEEWEFYSTIPNLNLIAVIGSSYEYINSSVGYDNAVVIKFYIKC